MKLSNESFIYDKGSPKLNNLKAKGETKNSSQQPGVRNGPLITSDELRDFEAWTVNLLLKHKTIKGISNDVKYSKGGKRVTGLDNSLHAQIVYDYKMTDGEIDVFEYFKAPKRKEKKHKARSKLYIPVSEKKPFSLIVNLSQEISIKFTKYQTTNILYI